MALTEKQEAFCREYLADHNATQAAIRAGYSAKTANRIASQNLSKLGVAKRLQELTEQRNERLEITADNVAEEFRRLGFSDLRQIASWAPDRELSWKSSEDLDDAAAAAIKDIQFTREVRTEKNGSEIETTNMQIKLHDKLGALKALGQHVGLFNRDGSGTNVTVNVNTKDAEERREQFASLHEQIEAYRQGHDDAERDPAEAEHPA